MEARKHELCSHVLEFHTSFATLSLISCHPQCKNLRQFSADRSPVLASYNVIHTSRVFPLITDKTVRDLHANMC